MNILIDNQIFPPVTLYQCLRADMHCYFFECEKYRRLSYCNRYIIAGAEGPIILSIPIRGGRHQPQPVKHIRIDNDQAWQARHWKSICSCYNHSPWFEFYKNELALFFEKPFELLGEFNTAAFEWVIRQLRFEVQLSYVQHWDPQFTIDLRGRFLLKSAPRNLDGLRYHQVFEERTGFIPHLSILDFLFCTGTQAKHILEAANEQA